MIKITIETNNDSFKEDVRGEIARILSSLVDSIHAGREPSRLMDSNGNQVGTVEWSI